MAQFESFDSNGNPKKGKAKTADKKEKRSFKGWIIFAVVIFALIVEIGKSTRLNSSH